MRFTDCIDITGESCRKFDGNKNYISTGAVDVNHIDQSQIESVNYDSKPSRANLMTDDRSILFAKMQGTKKVLLINEDLKENVYSTGFFSVAPKNNNILNKECLYHLLGSKTFLNQKDKYCSGATQKAITLDGLNKIEINIPKFEEQNQIAKRLDAIKRILDSYDSILKKYDNLIKARFVEMFGNPVNNDKEWIRDSVERLCKEIYGGGTPSKSHPEYYEDGEIPWITSKDMKTDILIDSQIHINEDGVSNSTARIVPKNSVIMVIRSGILKHTLPVAINAVPITVNQDLKVFIPGNRIVTNFLAYQFKMMEKDILSGVRAVTADNIEFDALKRRELIVPPIELQQQFSVFVQQVDKSKFLCFHQKIRKTFQVTRK